MPESSGTPTRPLALERVEPQSMAERRLVTFDLPAAILLKIGIAVLLLVLAGEVLSQIRDALVLVATSLFLAVALNPLVQRLERRLSRRLSVLAVFFLSLIHI